MTREECQQVFALLSEYIDGELPPDLCECIDHHIGECPPCVEFVESLRKSTRLCKGLKDSDRPDPLSQEARSALVAAYQRFLASGTDH